MVDPPNCVSDPPNSRLSGHADPPTSQRYFKRCTTSHLQLARVSISDTTRPLNSTTKQKSKYIK